MAFNITTKKELEKHVDFDISIITDNLKDGQFFGDEKKITPTTKIYTVTIPKGADSDLKPALKKLGIKSPFSKDTVELDTDTGITLRLRKTGKTSVGRGVPDAVFNCICLIRAGPTASEPVPVILFAFTSEPAI